jgi:uncharacterized protein (UPF0264 family)
VSSLLVSVRSADEALSALKGGAAVIDVKDPDRGPLGLASPEVWDEVRMAVPAGTPMSVALGELREWIGEGNATGPPPDRAPNQFRRFAFRKMGLSGVGDDWDEDWSKARRMLGHGPGWVAVIYADWERARAPRPDRVLDVAFASDDCGGVLIDTYDKSIKSPVDLTWKRWIDRARQSGLLVALGGGIDLEAIERLAPLKPDLFAVRGAACRGGDRRNPVDPALVAELAKAASLA